MLKIGFIGIGSSVYYSKEYHVYDNSLIALKLLVGKEFLIIEGGQIESREEAKIAISNLKNASVDYLLVQHSGFSMGDILLELDSCNIPFYNWAVEEPIENCDIKLHSLVSLNLYASSDMKFKTNNNYLGWFYGNPTNKIFISKFLKELSYIR